MKPPARLSDDIATFLRGICMGAADAIPGVSGGTVALVLGIYERLVVAISRFDRTLLAEVRRGKVRSAAQHVDLRFLVVLAAGIGTGIISLLHAMNFLLTDERTRPFTLAVFFGAILASSWIVARLIRPLSRRLTVRYVVLGMLGAAFAFLTTQLAPTDVHEPSLVYLFCCGVIAICAMILPGISGAYLLLVLGAYVYMSAALKDVVRGDFADGNLPAVVVFCSGCAIGLLSFSKLLRWLLTHFHAATMAVLCGFMIGALGRVWPFQVEIAGAIDPEHPAMQPVWPAAIDAHTVAVLLAAVVAGALVLVVDRWVRMQTARSAAEGRLSAGHSNAAK